MGSGVHGLYPTQKVTRRYRKTQSLREKIYYARRRKKELLWVLCAKPSETAKSMPTLLETFKSGSGGRQK